MMCSIPECQESTRCRGWCYKHYMRWRRHGDPLIKISLRGTRSSTQDDHHPQWKGDLAGYHAAHARTWKMRGKASDHACLFGCGKQAEQWAYDHLDLDERSDRRGPFSLKPEHYIPLCKQCHGRFDYEHRQLLIA